MAVPSFVVAAVINRNNYRAVKAFLKHQAEVKQSSDLTIIRYYASLRHLLRWADDTPLARAPKIRPVYPQHLLTLKQARAGKSPSKAVLRRECQVVRQLFHWLTKAYSGEYRQLDPLWIETIRPPKMGDEPPQLREGVTVDTVNALLSVSVRDGDLVTKRDKAAACFLFLSGMRATAFCTLPIECVNLADGTVLQYPSLGVETKFRKGATTRLLEISKLINIVAEWGAFLRERLPPSSLWYPVIRSNLGNPELTVTKPGKYRRATLTKNLYKLFDKAGLARMSPHDFRRGHAVYGYAHARDLADLKALSMDPMHSNLETTDSLYATLTSSDMQSRIAGLSQQATEDGLATGNGGKQREMVAQISAQVIEEVTRRLLAQSG